MAVSDPQLAHIREVTMHLMGDIGYGSKQKADLLNNLEHIRFDAAAYSITHRLAGVPAVIELAMDNMTWLDLVREVEGYE